MHILVSPNAFKNSLDAASAAKAMEEGLLQSGLPCAITCLPVGDGGDGTGTLLTQVCKGTTVNGSSVNALGKEIQASFGLIDQGKTAVIEMAAASGLHLLRGDELDPLHASSYGTGLQIKQALDKGVNKIILCVGGSATVDGGCGVLQALGVRFLDADKKEIYDLPACLSELDTIDLSAMDSRTHGCEWVVLCDVKNGLLGDNGAAVVFGPQKGASEEEVKELENCLGQLNRIMLQATGIDMAAMEHGGAAGGTAAGLHAVLHAKLVNGIEHFLDITGFDALLGTTDIVITGEGCLDRQTLEGKAPYGVAVRAKQRGIPVIALAGKIDPHDIPVLYDYFDVLLPIGNEPVDIKKALASTYENLVRTAQQVGKMLSICKQ